MVQFIVMRTLQYGFCALGAIAVFAAPVAFAAVAPPLPPLSGGATLPMPVTDLKTDIPNLFFAVLAWLFWGLLVFSIVMFLVGGYKYVTSAGESERVREANKTLLYAAIAAAVAFVAAGVPALISSFFSGGSGSGTTIF